MSNDAKGTRKTSAEFRKALESELQTYYEPKITNPDKAGSDELIRELYRVITGNGDFTKGLRYKVAVTSVMVDDVSERVEQVDGRVETQVKHCKEIQDLRAKAQTAREAEARGRQFSVANIGSAIRANKWIIFVTVVGAILYTHAIMSNRASSRDMETKLASFIDARLKTVVIEALNGK